MTVRSQFHVAARLGLATVVLMFGLIVLGSIVRTTGSGLACPDWPLCHGRLIPPFQFNILIEWFHRLGALLVSLLLAATTGWVAVHGALRARLGGLALLAVGLLAVQVLLGALTVWKLLDPGVVGGHLGVALLLFTTTLLLSLAAAAGAVEDTENPEDTAPRAPALLPLFLLVTIAVYAQSLLGGIVASHGAGLACPDWPTCNGEWFPAFHGLAGLQVAHRWGAYALTALLVFAALRARGAADPLVARAGSLLLALVLGQMALGVCNVLLQIDVALSALHLANATGMLAVAVATTFRLAIQPARGPDWARATA